MSKETQATASAKGYILQSYFGIYFILHNKNYRKMINIKIEAKEEDIVITYKNGSKDFIQVKTSENPNTQKFRKATFKKGMGTLKIAFEEAQKDNIEVNRLIYANNLIDQKNKRLTKRIKIADDINFIYNLSEFCTKEELIEFSKSSEFDISPKYYLSRIDESYLIGNNKVFQEMSQLCDSLNINDGKGLNIYDKLKTYVIENACRRKSVITTNQIALVFLKEKIKPEDLYDRFDKYYEEEIEEIDFYNIKELIEECYNECILSKISNYFRMNTHYSDIEIDFKNLKKISKIQKENRKTFIEFGYQKFREQEYLCFEKNISEEEEKMIYRFLFFLVYNKSKTTEEIYSEFDLGVNI